jgi:phosphatidylinositol glycan class C protein
MSVVVLFAIAYVSLDNGAISCDVILALSATSSFIGYLCLHCFVITSPPTTLASLLKDLQHVAIFLSFGLGLSPVLYKLTDTISTDTIYTTAGVMLFVHLVFHNFGLEKAADHNPLSLNAALFASVCLASRLSSSYDAFVLLALSVVAFVLFPIFRLLLDGPMLLGVTLVTSICVVVLTAYYYAISASICAAAAFVIVIGLCPSLFVHWQSYKYTIHGPWDEAVPNIMQER